MDNSDFSHLFRLGSSTSSAVHLEDTQAEQTVEQEQQTTFTGRVTSSRDSENPVLATSYASQAVVTRAPTRSAAATTRSMTTRPVVTRSTEQCSPAIDDPANPSFTSTPFLTAISASQPIAQSTSVLFLTDSPTDTFASLFALQPISFPDNQEHLYGGFDSFSAFLDTYLPEGAESEPIISQPSGQSTLAPVMDSPMRQVSRQDNNLPANPSVSYPEDATGPAPNVVADSGIPLLSTPPLQRPLRPKPPQSRVGSPPIRILSKVKVSMCKEHPSDKWLYRSDSKVRPFLCGYSGCGRLFKVRSHFREHMFDHTQTSNHRCTYPECGPNRYFRRSRDLKRHIEKVHADQKS